ncbi:MAG: choice-of-anchor tandem repeat NxxGxxAF-containing protein [Acidobacteriota bacterium]
MSRFGLIFAVVLASSAAAATASARGICEDLEVVATTGQQAADLPEGIVYQGFVDFDLNDRGQMTFRAFLSGDGVTFHDDGADFLAEGGTARLVARDGDQAAGLPPGIIYQGLSCFHCDLPPIAGPRINNAGRVVFTTLLDDRRFNPLGAGEGMFSDVGSRAIDLVVRSGDFLPLEAGAVRIQHLPIEPGRVLLAETGDVALVVGVSGLEPLDLPPTAILTGRPGAPGRLAVVAHSGRQAPDLPEGLIYRSLTLLGLTTRGGVIFSGGVTDVMDPRSPVELDLFGGRRDHPRLLVRQGDRAPGLPDGVILRDLGRFSHHGVRANRRGDLAITAGLDGPGIVEGDNDSAIFVGSPDSLELLVQRGDQAAGFPPGTFYTRLFPAVMNNRGRVAFPASVDTSSGSGTGDDAIFSDVAGALDVVVREGDQVPGEAEGTTFGQPGCCGRAFDVLQIDDAGRILFEAAIADGSSRRGPFLAGPDGQILPLLRPGDPIVLGDGTVRTVVRIGHVELTAKGWIGVHVGFHQDFHPQALLVGRADCKGASRRR